MTGAAGRGWIFVDKTAATRVASISNTGVATFNGGVNIPTGQTYKINGVAHTHGTYDNTTVLTGASVYSKVGVTDGIVVELTSRTLSYSDIGAAASSHTHSTLTISSPLSGTSYNGGSAVTIGLADGYGDTKNPYASKTAKYFLASPNDASGVPSFRAITHTDIPSGLKKSVYGSGPSSGSNSGTSWSAIADYTSYTINDSGTYLITYTGTFYGYRSSLGHMVIFVSTSSTGDSTGSASTTPLVASATASDAVGSEYYTASGSVVKYLEYGTKLYFRYKYKRGGSIIRLRRMDGQLL